jgi:hypothetical protein
MLNPKFRKAYAMACAMTRAKNKRLLVLAWCLEVKKQIGV